MSKLVFKLIAVMIKTDVRVWPFIETLTTTGLSKSQFKIPFLISVSEGEKGRQ